MGQEQQQQQRQQEQHQDVTQAEARPPRSLPEISFATSTDDNLTALELLQLQAMEGRVG
jgi:hypothetical protein